MDKLELYPSELVMLKEVIEADMQTSGWSECDYDDVELMKYYYDRAKILVKVKELIND
jgi:hypothetical protein